MSDPFNSLISTGASPVLFAASNMAGQYRQRNDFLEEQRQSRNQNMMQFIMQQGEASRQNQQQDRQFQLQYAQGERAIKDCNGCHGSLHTVFKGGDPESPLSPVKVVR